MSHLSDDELVLHYYGEDGTQIVATESHLRSCAQCAGAYEALARTLTAVTPPAFVDTVPGVEVAAIRQMIRDRLSGQPPPRSASHRGIPALRGEGRLLALVWLVPLLYPFSPQALFSGVQLAQEHVVAMPLAVLALMWACAGPVVAVFALNHLLVDSFRRASTRLIVFGALIASISPGLFVLGSRIGLGLSMWYGAVTLLSVLALFRWRNSPLSTARLLYVHRLSALVLTVFAVAHISNQVSAFVSLSAYTTTRDIFRVVYQQPAIRILIVVSVAIQIATGAAMGMKKVRAGALAANMQAVSGWYLAAFLLIHVFSGLVVNQIHPATPVATTAATTAGQFGLLASARFAAQVPFLLLGVAAFLFHVGVYARLVALAFLAEAWVRRLSYAAAFVGTTVVLTVALALCGIHLIR